MNKKKLALFLYFTVINISLVIACTVGVSLATNNTNNRPLLWKNRDVKSYDINTIKYVENENLSFIGISTPNTNKIWMGANSTGFAIVNSYTNDLGGNNNGGFDNGDLIYYALSSCESMNDFKTLIENINASTILKNISGNFLCFDNFGVCKTFEISNSDYSEFSTSETLKPFIVRTNFSISGGSSYSYHRFLRSNTIIQNLSDENNLNVNNLLKIHNRDCATLSGTPYELPHFPSDPTPNINTTYSICNYKTISSVVIEGVQPGEDPKLTTIWLIMGNPFTTFAIPLLPSIQPNISQLNQISQTCSELRSILWDVSGSYLSSSYFINNNFSLLNFLEEKETTLYESFTQQKIEWANNQISDSEISNIINDNVQAALSFSNSFINSDNENEDVESINNHVEIYPNPIKQNSIINISSKSDKISSVSIYNIKGQLIKSYTNNTFDKDFSLALQKKLSKGIYFFKIKKESKIIAVKKVLLIG